MKKILLLIIAFAFLVKNNASAQYWSSLGTGITGPLNYVYGDVKSLVMYNGSLYAGGQFDTAGGIAASCVAKWNGVNWSALGAGINYDVYTMAEYNGELYVGGPIASAGGDPANYIAKWNGTNWSAVGTGMNNIVYSLAVYNGELYAGGLFDTAGGVQANCIAKWNGTNWSPVGTGTDGVVICLEVYNGELYAGGEFFMAGGVQANCIAKWNGINWSAVGSGMDYDVLALTVFNGELHAAGWFQYAGGIPANFIAKWNGTNWSALGAGLTIGTYGWGVQTLAVYHGSLYAGGEITFAGSEPVKNIARWDGANWSGAGNGTNNYAFALCAHDTALYVGGFFDHVNESIPANRVAKWIDYCSIPPPQPGAIYGSNAVCQGRTETYFITPVNGASGYTWSLPPGWTGSSTNNSITTIVGTSGGTISVIASNSCGSSSSQTLAVTVNSTPPPQPGAINGNNSVCQGSSQIYSVSPVNGASAYIWHLPPGWTGSSNTNSITATVGANGGIISVVANNSCGSSNSQTLAVSVNSVLPQPGAINGNNSVCQGSTQTYSISPVNGALNYTWTLPPGWTGSSTSNSITTTTGTSGGVILVTANNSCGSSNSQTFAVTVNSVPLQPGTINGNNSICQGTIQTYSISPVTGALNYTWTLPPGWTGSSISNSLTTTTGTSSGTISVIANNTCGSSSPQTFAVTVSSTPPRPGAINGNNPVCKESMQTYFVSPVNGASGYTWNLPSGWTGSSNTNSITATAGISGGILSVSANNSCGNSNSETIVISVESVPARPDEITGDLFVNTGRSYSYSINPVNGATGYAWTISGGGIITTGQNNSTAIIDWQTEGVYILSVYAFNTCGSGMEQRRTINVTRAGDDDPYEIKLMPNPSSGEFYLKAKRVQDKLIDIIVQNTAGQVVYRRGKLRGSNNYSELIDLKKMAGGLYVVKVFVDDKVYMRKIIKTE